MSDFYKAPFSVRYGQMGDLSEKQFERLMPQHHRLGLSRPPFSMATLPSMLRCLPDYLTPAGLVEVMGIGRDKTLKLRVEKMEALQQWKLIYPVFLFVYDSNRNRWWLSELENWNLKILQHGEIDHFPDNNKPFIRLHVDNFPVEAVKDSERGKTSTSDPT